MAEFKPLKIRPDGTGYDEAKPGVDTLHPALIPPSQTAFDKIILDNNGNIVFDNTGSVVYST
jgi:hypothetical protein